MEGILDTIRDDGVACVSTAIEPRAEIVVSSEDVDELALALVTPLGTENSAEARVEPMEAGRLRRKSSRRYSSDHFLYINYCATGLFIG